MTSEVNETLPTPNWDHEENLARFQPNLFSCFGASNSELFKTYFSKCDLEDDLRGQ